MKRMALICSLVSLGFQSLFALSLEDATCVYKENESSVLPFEAGDYLFVEASWTVAPRQRHQHAEALALTAAFKQIVKDYAEIDSVESPFSPKFSTWLKRPVPFNVAPVQQIIVEREASSNEGRCIIAYDLKGIHQARQAYADAANALLCRTEADWKKRLEETYLSLSKQIDKHNFFSLLGCPVMNVVLADASEDYGREIPETEAAWAELNRLLAILKGEEASYLKDVDVLRSQKSAFFYSPLNYEAAKPLFEEAKGLYRKGKDLPKILALLSESLRYDPTNVDAWCYLGGALRADKKPLDAAVAYLQAARLDRYNPFALVGLRDACRDAGLTCHTEGLRWALQMKDFEPKK